ncbi:Na(+)-translocating NADH-quinone reductase subunit A [Stieleria sp. ICT_E10.1]|uniref:Na(+)-translocating NADH-quinone reductase subunit A n=1 Tax=Stieleria sedimenti TaxID=2976331 RepID=UPI0021803E51|nr:Na(+)-translocating NADH-quinone reductase subunit A [Stieleria sedimenti]MCS7467519.1 Na(+)-translocating NADH-quinone reductase subunit A [Stieleria sedimenti]
MITIKEGLDLPILGTPAQHIEVAKPVTRVALVGDDYIGMKPTMLVAPGDKVKLGQPLFTDKKTEGVTYTSPAAGTVADVIRGEKRKFEAVVIDVDPSPGESDSVSFDVGDVNAMDAAALTELLVTSGLWTALRTRPFGKVPAPGTKPSSIFVQAIDTNPLAACPATAMADRKDQFILGLTAITKLTDGTVHVCKAPGSAIPGGAVDGVTVTEFGGPHPAGLVGTHIHELDPVGPTKKVWYLGYQDVMAIGALLTTGKLDVRRVISLAGPVIGKPRLLETRIGADISQLVDGEYDAEMKVRQISGSVLCGRTANPPHNFLGRYHTQISVIQEGDEREFLGWQKPGFDKFSTTRVFASTMLPNQKFAFTTSTGGSERAMVPLGTYEKVMPLDILPTQLLRALIVRDTDQAQQLGALELEEEDLALCTFVCPGKYEYGSLLRENLTTIEREG